MDLKQREQDGVAILDLIGELRGGPADSSLFKGAIDTCIAADQNKILLNLTDLKWINSTGLGFIVAAFTELKKVDGVLRLCSANERIDAILETTRFNLVIDIFATEEEALTDY